jgi:hypothetical protein
MSHAAWNLVPRQQRPRTSAMIKRVGFAAALTVFLGAVPAQAQAVRTFVSAATGNDLNPCSRTTPCATFAGALPKTIINGEINCLDPGGYGAVAITKSITIDCKGKYASILASGVTGITVNIRESTNDPTRSVRIRGLSINGTGASGTSGTRTGLTGIRVTAATSLFIEDTVIGDFSQQGIQVQTNGTFNLSLDRVVIRNTNSTGVALSATTGQVVAWLNNVRISGTSSAVALSGLTRANLRNVTMAHNGIGISTGGLNNVVNAENVMVSFATTGLRANTTGAIRLANSVITQNATGLNPNGGAIVSLSNNSVTGNTTDGAFTSTTPQQ